MKSIFLTLLFLGALALGVYSAFQYDRVLLEDVKVLTFKKNQWTTARRTYPIPQLVCTGGSAVKKHSQVENVQCTNQGLSDNGDPSWKCEAALDKTLKLGQVDVLCEGFSHSNDRFILVGSCGLEYTLEFTDYYYQQQKPVNTVIHTVQTTTTRPLITYDNDALAQIYVFFLFFFVVVCIILCCAYASPSRRIPEIELNDPPTVRHGPTYVGPTYIGPTPSYGTTTVVVDNSADAQAAGFVTGLAVASALNKPQVQPVQPVHTHTETTTIIRDSNCYDSDSDCPRSGHAFSTGGTYTSTSYGSTKRR